MSMSSSSEDGRSTRTAHAGGQRQRAVTRAAVRAEARRDRIRWAQQQAVGPAAVSVRHDHDLGGALPRLECSFCPASSVSSSRASSAGQSPGMQSTRSRPSASARRTPSVTAADWPSSRVVGDQQRAVLPRGLSQARLAADDDTCARSSCCGRALAARRRPSRAQAVRAARRRRSRRAATWRERSA